MLPPPESTHLPYTTLFRSQNVFINCPFDEEYQPIFNALVFATFDCGLRPRFALEVYDAGEVRIEKIARIVGEDRKSTRLNSSHPSTSYAVLRLQQKPSHRP